MAEVVLNGVRENAGSKDFRRSRVVVGHILREAMREAREARFSAISFPRPRRPEACGKQIAPRRGALVSAAGCVEIRSIGGRENMTEEMGIEDGIRWIRDRTTGEIAYVDFDGELKSAMQEFHATVCEHTRSETMRVEVASGAIQVRRCCRDCGARIGNPEKQTDPTYVASLPLQPIEDAARYEKARREDLYQLLLKHALRQTTGRRMADNFYQEYLKSPEWERIRQKVIARCGNVCEGCGDREVEHVHHMTYDHLGNEFLFELLGLCIGCHDRVHGKPARRIR